MAVTASLASGVSANKWEPKAFEEAVAKSHAGYKSKRFLDIVGEEPRKVLGLVSYGRHSLKKVSLKKKSPWQDQDDEFVYGEHADDQDSDSGASDYSVSQFIHTGDSMANAESSEEDEDSDDRDDEDDDDDSNETPDNSPGDDEAEQDFIDGCNNDSPLGCAIGKALTEEPKVEAPFPKTGEEKLALLARVLCGNLDEVLSGGKTERCYIKVTKCNYADLQGEKKRPAELAKQIEKARAKGLTELPQKWYWVWYENQKTAEKPDFPKPDGFFPMLSIVNVLRDLSVENQFTMRYTEDGQKGEIKYKRVDKQLDIWIEGLEIFNSECRQLHKATKDSEEAEEFEKKAMAQMRGLHAAYCQSRGFPKTPDEWKAWFGYLKLNGNPDKLIEKFYEEVQAQAKAQQEALAKAKTQTAAAAPKTTKAAAKGPPAAKPKA